MGWNGNGNGYVALNSGKEIRKKGRMAFRQETWTENVTCKIAFIVGSSCNRGWWMGEKKRKA